MSQPSQLVRNAYYTARIWLPIAGHALRERARATAFDAHWREHPAVATASDLTIGERAADYMRSWLGTWAFLFTLAGAMALWIATSGLGHDPAPYIGLNLCLSTLAGVQAAVLLIAAKRSDAVAAATALHTLENTESLKALIEANTALTEQIEQLTRAVHDHLTAAAAATSSDPPQPQQPQAVKE